MSKDNNASKFLFRTYMVDYDDPDRKGIFDALRKFIEWEIPVDTEDLLSCVMGDIQILRDIDHNVDVCDALVSSCTLSWWERHPLRRIVHRIYLSARCAH